MKKVCSIVLSTIALGFGFVAAPSRAQFAYVANRDNNSVSGYSIGADGALTPVPGSPFAAGDEPVSVAVDPTGKFAYLTNVGNGPVEGTVSAYRVGSDGALTPVPGSPFATTGIGPNSVAVDPLDRFVYVPNASASSPPPVGGPPSCRGRQQRLGLRHRF
jgi:6-phosphogluconolactonase